MVEKQKPPSGWELALTGREVLEGYKGELVEWSSDLALPAVPPLEWLAEQYFSRSLEIPKAPDDILPQAWFTRQLARENRIRLEKIPTLASSSIDGLRTMVASRVGQGKPFETTNIDRFLSASGRPITRILLERHPDFHQGRLKAIQRGDIFEILESEAPPFTGLKGLPGGLKDNITGHAEYDELFYVREMRNWHDQTHIPLSVLATMDWIAALCRSKDELWVPPETKSWYIRLLRAFNHWLEVYDVH